jgi:hypothetical protein
LYHDFEDFADAYHVNQVFAMLVQFLVEKTSQNEDFKPTPYVICKKVEQALMTHRN